MGVIHQLSTNEPVLYCIFASKDQNLIVKLKIVLFFYWLSLSLIIVRNRYYTILTHYNKMVWLVNLLYKWYIQTLVKQHKHFCFSFRAMNRPRLPVSNPRRSLTCKIIQRNQHKYVNDKKLQRDQKDVYSVT